MERLPDLLESVARLRVKVAGVLKGTRREINFTSNDSSITITATDDGVNEKLTLDLVAASGGADTWEVVAGDLHPVSNPNSFQLTTVTLDANIQAARDVNLTAAEDVTVFPTRDLQETIGRDANITTAGNWDVDATGDAGITSAGYLDLLGGVDTTVRALSGNMFLKTPSGAIYSQALASAPSNPAASMISFYLDEVGNNLKVLVTYSDGTTHKTGTLPLI